MSVKSRAAMREACRGVDMAKAIMVGGGLSGQLKIELGRGNARVVWGDGTDVHPWASCGRRVGVFGVRRGDVRVLPFGGGGRSVSGLPRGAASLRRGGRVAEGDGLLNRCTGLFP